MVTGRLPKDWNEYLRCSSNKTELLEFMSESVLRSLHPLEVVSNVGDTIKSSGPRTNLEGAKGLMEEADGRIILHLKDMAEHGATSVLSAETQMFLFSRSPSFIPSTCLGWRSCGYSSARENTDDI